MKFNELMHASCFCENIELIRDFYENKLGLKPKMLIRNSAYLNDKNSDLYEEAQTNKDGICIIYYEICERQFIEFIVSPKNKGKYNHMRTLGISHFALTVDDIFETRKEFVEKGIPIDSEPSIGNSKTWKMWTHDPEGNAFEVMQFTEESYQLCGHIDKGE